MNGELLAFGVLAALTLGSALLVVASRNIAHAALWLLPCLAGVAGLYLLLGVEYLAAIQVILYIGGILVLLLFAIMLTPGVAGRDRRVFNRQVFWAFVSCALLAGVLIHLLARQPWEIRSFSPPRADIGGFADALLGPYLLPFEVASVALLAAIVGAIVLAREERE
jgi:NADH-quinone oxidoreductase subunit J